MGPFMRTFVLAAFALGVPVSPVIAFDPCEPPPQAVSYLSANPDWAVIRPGDLDRDQAYLWTHHHRDLCPGFAYVDLDGSGHPYLALGLIKRGLLRNTEKVVLLRETAAGQEVRVLIPEERADNPPVLFRLPPGTAKEWDNDTLIAIPHDSLGIAWLDASARQYFWDKGEFRCVHSAD